MLAEMPKDGPAPLLPLYAIHQEAYATLFR